MSADLMVLSRDVTRQECPWLPRDLSAGTPVALFQGATYGCITPSGTPISLVEGGGNPFYEVPTDALEDPS